MQRNTTSRAKLVGLLVVFSQTSAIARGDEDNRGEAAPSRMEIKSVQKIWDHAPHNAFTSLLRFNGKWYCTFREAEAHVVGPAAARVLVSDDGQQWKSAAVLREEGLDARDPHLSITPQNELMLLSARATQSGKDRTFQTVVRFSKDGRQWSEPVAVGEPEFWIWSATWHDGECYAVGYKHAEPYQARLYHSKDGRKFETVVDDLGIGKYPNESSIVFDPDGTAHCLLRCSGPAQLGTAKPPYKNWKWTDTGVPIGGPALIALPNGKWIAAGRKYSKPEARTMLWWLDPATAKLTEALALPSGGDNSYPGLVWHDGLLWVSYYSAHEGKCNIYLAKIAIDDADAVGANVNPRKQIGSLATDEQVTRFTKSRAVLASDPYRPLYHFSAPEGLLNDPNGLCQWQGNYHLFYQIYPAGQRVVQWGHAYSSDLVHWKDLPLAITPTIEKQIASGQTLVERDRVIAIYHGGGVGNCIATASDPFLLDWRKHPANPVIPIVKTDAGGSPYRIFDPCIWKEDDGYYSLSGVYKDGARGKDAKLSEPLFRSKDLAKWEYLGPLIEGRDWTEPGEDGAVPNFLPIGNGKHLLLFFSHKRASQYFVGNYDTAAHKYKPDYHGRMNYGPWVMGSLHAPSSFVDDSGRFVAIFNVRENRLRAEEVYGAKDPGVWYGIMTLPRRLWLDARNGLHVAPISELEKLRFAHQGVAPSTIPANEEIVLKDVAGKAIEIDALFEPGKSREFGLHVLRSPDGVERTTITVYMNVYEAGQRQLGIDVSHASLRPDVKSRSPEIGPFAVADNEPIRLRVFVDRSIVEIFANDVQCLTLRAYPQRDDSRGVAVFARGSDARLVSLDAWQIHSVWPELNALAGR